jgi:primary-amine oxidase
MRRRFLRKICTLPKSLTPVTADSDARVLYFNLGSHHVPHSGDIPNTLMHTSASSVMFTPFNFHDRDPSRRSAQGVKLELTGLETKPKYFGGRHEEDVTLKAVSPI